MKYTYRKTAQFNSTLPGADRCLALVSRLLLGLLCCVAVTSTIYAQKKPGTGHGESPEIRAGILQITNISTSTVVASDGKGNAIKFNRPASKLNVGQNLWVSGNKLRVSGNKVMGVGLPIKGSIKNKIGQGDWMETEVTISNTGRIDATTETWTTVCADGFTGGVMIFLFDNNGNVLHSTPLKKYGVNGTCVPSSPSKRTELWNDTVSLEIVNKTRSVKIVHVKKPTDRIDEFLEKTREVAEIVKIFVEIYTDVAGGGGGTGGSGPTGPTPIKPKVP